LEPRGTCAGFLFFAEVNRVRVSRVHDIRSEDKSAIMSDLDREIVRRREIEKVEKN
jgi:hypothetical protein